MLLKLRELEIESIGLEFDSIVYIKFLSKPAPALMDTTRLTCLLNNAAIVMVTE